MMEETPQERDDYHTNKLYVTNLVIVDLLRQHSQAILSSAQWVHIGTSCAASGH